jgi:hypothetical protein
MLYFKVKLRNGFLGRRKKQGDKEKIMFLGFELKSLYIDNKISGVLVYPLPDFYANYGEMERVHRIIENNFRKAQFGSVGCSFSDRFSRMEPIWKNYFFLNLGKFVIDFQFPEKYWYDRSTTEEDFFLEWLFHPTWKRYTRRSLEFVRIRVVAPYSKIEYRNVIAIRIEFKVCECLENWKIREQPFRKIPGRVFSRGKFLHDIDAGWKAAIEWRKKK